MNFWAGAYSGGGAKGARPPPPQYFEGQLPLPQNFKRGKEKRKKDERKKEKNCYLDIYIILFFFGGGDNKKFVELRAPCE